MTGTEREGLERRCRSMAWKLDKLGADLIATIGARGYEPANALFTTAGLCVALLDGPLKPTSKRSAPEQARA